MANIKGRFLIDGQLLGTKNMARDEALLICRTQPTFRVYRWSRPTLSLGYFQKHCELPIKKIMDRGCDVVRRATGGKAIMHEHEITYSLCAPEKGLLSHGPGKAMEEIHQLLAQELSQESKKKVSIREQNKLLSDYKESAWCFEDSSPLDLCLEGRKLLGSAARRQKGWVLFHGSLVIKTPEETPGVASLGFEPNFNSICYQLGLRLNIDFNKEEWTAEELKIAETIEKEKYQQEDFTYKR
jgi:lipoate-protein ligase A